MADEAVQSEAPEEQEPEQTEETPSEEAAKAPGPKQAKPPTARFGSLLMQGREAWTVKSSDKGGVTIMRRVGNQMEERRLTSEQFQTAKATKIPQDLRAKGSAWFGRGLSMDLAVQIPEAFGGAARINGYDAASGEVQLDIPGRGPTWVARSTVQDLVLSDGDREKGAANFFAAMGVKPEKKKEEKRKEKKKKEKPVEKPTLAPPPAPLAPPVTPLATRPAPPVEEAEVEAEVAPEAIVQEVPVAPPAEAAPKPVPEKPAVVVTRAIPVGGPPLAAPSVVVSRTVPIGEAPAATVVQPLPPLLETDLQAELTKEQLRLLEAQHADGLSESETARLRSEYRKQQRAMMELKAGRTPEWGNLPSGVQESLLRSELTKEQIRLLESQHTEGLTEADTAKFREEYRKHQRSMMELKAGRMPELTNLPSVVQQRLKVTYSAIPAIPTTPSVRVSRTVPVGAKAAPPTVAPSKVSVSVEIPQPSIRETREQLKVEIKAAGAQAPRPAPPAGRMAAIAGVASAVAGAIGGAAPVSAVVGGYQQQLYARAANALDVLGARVADRRGSIQEMQKQADGLRQEIAGLNAQAAAPGAGAYRAPDVSVRLSEATQELGGLQNRLALARYGQQTDEAQMQQLKIVTGLMRNAAPEVQSGQLPKSIVALVAQSIPSDVPEPSPERAAALAAMLGQPQVVPAPEAVQGPKAGEAPVAPVPPPRSYAAAPPQTLAQPTPEAGPGATGVAEHVRQNLRRKGLTLPEATAVGFISGQQADRGVGGYEEGLGMPDAQTAAYSTEGAGARPVIDTIPKSYGEAKAPEEAADVFETGTGANAEFMKKQKEAQATQEQFLPGTTGGLPGPDLATETERRQRVRPEEGPSPDEDALRAASLQAQQARTRAAALKIFGAGQDEEEKQSIALSVKNKLKQAESARKVFSVLLDMFDAATIEDILGGIMLILNMNGRLLTGLLIRNPKSILRKFLPAAQFPIEMAAIVAVDIIVATIVFVSAVAFFLPFIILIGLAVAGVLGFVELLA